MLLKFKPTTPGLRGTVLVSKKELSKEKPHKSLTKKFIILVVVKITPLGRTKKS